ncbi:MAG: EF-Tu/IF-2/RF-3 family GTPase [Promethearchaeota archaeon]
MVKCDPNGPLIICLSKVQVDKHGLVGTGRIFSGKCGKKQEVFLLKENNYDTIQRIAIFMGQRREQVEEIPVGNIIAIEGLKEVKSGESLIDPDYLDKMIPFENVKYVSTPVVTVSIEPEFLRELDKMKLLIENLLIEDPNLRFEVNEENGEFLLSGMGPLHLEVSSNEIEKRGVQVSISEPRAVFKESCRYNSSLITVTSPNGDNSLKLKIERLDNKTTRFFQSTDYNSIKPFDRLKEVLREKTNLSVDEIENFWKSDSDQNLLVYQGEAELSDNYKNMIQQIFEKIHLNGPLCSEKLTEIKVIIDDLNINKIDEESAFTELSAMFYEAIKKGLRESELVLLEPIYHTIIQLPPDYIRNIDSLLSKNSAKIKSIDQEKDYQAVIEILLPVRNSLKFAEEIRLPPAEKHFGKMSSMLFWKSLLMNLNGSLMICDSKRVFHGKKFRNAPSGN